MKTWKGRRATTGQLPSQAKGEPQLAEARALLLKAMDSMDQDEEWYNLGGRLGQMILAAHSDFDTRTYGRKKLSELVGDLKIFETRRGTGNQLEIRRID